jgi:hypothetical protein
LLTFSLPSPIATQSTIDKSGNRDEKGKAIKIFILLNNFSWRVKNIEIYYPLDAVKKGKMKKVSLPG